MKQERVVRETEPQLNFDNIVSMILEEDPVKSTRIPQKARTTVAYGSLVFPLSGYPARVKNIYLIYTSTFFIYFRGKQRDRFLNKLSIHFQPLQSRPTESISNFSKLIYI